MSRTHFEAFCCVESEGLGRGYACSEVLPSKEPFTTNHTFDSTTAASSVFTRDSNELKLTQQVGRVKASTGENKNKNNNQ